MNDRTDEQTTTHLDAKQPWLESGSDPVEASRTSRNLLATLTSQVDRIEKAVLHIEDWWRAHRAEIEALMPEDLEALKARCAARKAAILKALYGVSPRARATAKIQGIDPDEIEDLYQQAFIRAHEKFDPSRRASFHTFLIRSCLRTKINGHFRRTPVPEPLGDRIEYVRMAGENDPLYEKVAQHEAAAHIDHLVIQLREVLQECHPRHLKMALMRYSSVADPTGRRQGSGDGPDRRAGSKGRDEDCTPWEDVGNFFGTSAESARVTVAKLESKLRKAINSDNSLGKDLVGLFYKFRDARGGSEDPVPN